MWKNCLSETLQTLLLIFWNRNSFKIFFFCLDHSEECYLFHWRECLGRKTGLWTFLPILLHHATCCSDNTICVTVTFTSFIWGRFLLTGRPHYSYPSCKIFSWGYDFTFVEALGETVLCLFSFHLGSLHIFKRHTKRFKLQVQSCVQSICFALTIYYSQ